MPFFKFFLKKHSQNWHTFSIKFLKSVTINPIHTLPLRTVTSWKHHGVFLHTDMLCDRIAIKDIHYLSFHPKPRSFKIFLSVGEKFASSEVYFSCLAWKPPPNLAQACDEVIQRCCSFPTQTGVLCYIATCIAGTLVNIRHILDIYKVCNGKIFDDA